MQDLSIYDNSWYRPGRSALVRFAWLLVSALCFRSGIMPFSIVLVTILRLFGAKVGSKVTIKPGVLVKHPWHLTVGDHVWIGENVWIDNLCPVVIEDHVCISQGAMLLTGNHNYKAISFDLQVRPITLRRGVWIGARATVCPGVECGSYSILTVGSVATGSMDDCGIYSGVPASKVRERTAL